MKEPESEPELWARPRETVPVDDHHLLRVHLAVVARRMAESIDGCQLSISDGRETEFCQIVGRCHDFGKATEWFQQMIRGEGEVARGDPLTYHSLLGAFLCMFALEKQGFSPTGQALGGIVVMAHHSSMPDPADRAKYHTQLPRTPGVRNALTETYNRIDRQLTSIVKRAPEQATRVIEEVTAGDGSLDGFREYVSNRDPVRTLAESRLSQPGGTPKGLYADVLLCYSALKFADTSHSAGAIDAELLASRPLDRAALECHLDSFTTRDGVQRQLDDLRTKAQAKVTDRTALLCEDRADAPRVGTIWLPTGFGKTIAGLRAALELSERARKDRIIYALPFTSIIDQVGTEIEEVFGVDPGSPEFIVHHYLSDGAKAIERSSPTQPVDSSLQYLLGGAWRAGCVLTTFVQVFESLIAPRQSQAPKVPAIRNSVLILDEPQEFPPRLWPLLARIIEVLVDRLDVHVIVMTATQPGFFEFHSSYEVVPLIDDQTPFVEFLRRNPRVRYRLHPSAHRYVEASDDQCEDELPITHEDAAVELCDAFDADDIRSVLTICNTVSSSRTLFDIVREELQRRGRSVVSPALVLDQLIEENDESPTVETLLEAIQTDVKAVADSEPPVIALNLTTRHRPPDRGVLIDALVTLIDECTRGALDGRILCTATRLLEAGVDIGVDRVYRDIAQVPSIVQSGGRCNREFDSAGDGGVVTVWRLGEIKAKDGSREQVKSGQTPAQHIYGGGASGEGGMAQTRAALRDRGTEIDEGDMITEVVESFFAAMHEYGHGDTSYADALDRADVDVLREVQLIEEQPWQADVIVTRTSDERDATQSLKQELAVSPADRNKKRVKRLLNGLSTLRFAIPDPRDEQGAVPEGSGFVVLTSEADGPLWLDVSVDRVHEFDAEKGVI